MTAFVGATTTGQAAEHAPPPTSRRRRWIPYLLLLPKAQDVIMLEALDRWVRSLASTLSTGKSITDSIRTTRRTPPPNMAESRHLRVNR